MKINFTPQRRDDDLLLTVAGDVVSVNGVAYDLSVITEGATLPAAATDCLLLSGDISRINGELSLTVFLPHKADPHKAIAFPEPVNISSGVVVDTVNGIYPWSLT